MQMSSLKPYEFDVKRLNGINRNLTLKRFEFPEINETYYLNDQFVYVLWFVRQIKINLRTTTTYLYSLTPWNKGGKYIFCVSTYIRISILILKLKKGRKIAKLVYK